MVNRIIELWKRGGVSEVLRGVRDFLGMDNFHAKIVKENILTIDDIKIRFEVQEAEDLKRSRGHGEVDVIKDFIREVRSDDVVWDIGANIGTYSLFAAKKGANVIAFEPATDALYRLYKNINLNSVEISVQEIALANENTKRTLVNKDKSGHRKLAEGDGEKVEVRRGDKLKEENPDLVKIDVEGTEHEVIQGMEGILSGVRVFYIEFHEDVAKSEIISLLRNKGFSISREFDGDTDRNIDIIKFKK